MEGYFPGLTDHLVSLGADYGDVSEKARYYFEGCEHHPTISGINAHHSPAEVRYLRRL